MKKLIVLLRGINVTGKNPLPMKELVALLVGLGCENVKTVIQSGNVVLESNLSAAALQDNISAEILAKKGFKVQVLVLPVNAFKKAVDGCPFQTPEGKLLHYFFCATTPTSVDNERLANLSIESEEYALKGSTFYLFAPNGIGRSKLATNVEKVLGVPTTARNHNTILKLLELVG